MEKTSQTRVRKRTRTVALGAPPTSKRITLDPNKHQTGRESKLIDPKMHQRLMDALVAGNTIRNACIMAKIGESTYHRWMAEAEIAPEGHPLKEFRESVKGAMAQAEHRNVMIIQKAAPRQWQAAAWFLERRNPEAFGRREFVAMGGDGLGQPIAIANIPKKALTDEAALVAVQRILQRRLPTQPEQSVSQRRSLSSPASFVGEDCPD